MQKTLQAIEAELANTGKFGSSQIELVLAAVERNVKPAAILGRARAAKNDTSSEAMKELRAKRK